MKIISGDILEIKEGVVCHQVNSKMSAGRGLTKRIRLKYTWWYEVYKTECRSIQLNSHEIGKIVSHYLHENKELVIVDLFCQLNYGTTFRDMDYDAFRKCLENIKSLHSDRKIYIPYGIGCDSQKGSWDVVCSIIEDVLPDTIIVQEVIKARIMKNGEKSKRVVKFGDPLSKREKQVIMMLCEGESNKFAGKELGITNQTMKNHLSAIYKKLGLLNRTQLALWVQKVLADGKEKV